ncbi:uncharacterized protein LOC132749745 [Ruditapes philippinarum]|uniref:uncharacterized protein LOC132749745 n=1 Tax=Ruditapes philippinarum TaxID=129788 RepID=UPI00295B4937|nr:uncharacterized protein LOC132749745 [Ruditapes philippinarum]
MATSITLQLLDYTIDGYFSKAKALCDEATVEINTLKRKYGKHFTDCQTHAIENVRRVINHLVTNQTMSAKRKPMKEVHPSDRTSGIQNHYIDEQKGEDSRHLKRAIHALRLNNPDIPDLSDTNRPTKIAEKFSELYDNEWTEAFESLCKTETSSEKRNIETLLNIVQDGYEFCRVEADRQIDNLQSICIRFIKGEQLPSSRKYTDPPYDKGREHLVQYRKDIAQLSLSYLTDKFKSQMKIQYSDKGIIAYVDKAVELTWLMAVQDPPVYMCPTTTHFDSNLYKPFTRPGKTPYFFVWPALKLCEDGGLLMKGVVQYKH